MMQVCDRCGLRAERGEIALTSQVGWGTSGNSWRNVDGAGMKPMKIALVALLVLAGCGGNPFGIDRDVDGDGPVGTDGTENASPNGAIRRVEERVDTGANLGNGYAEQFIYNAANDTFTVDNLAFDGANVYARSAVQPSLGPFEVYEATVTETDSVTGAVINQFIYRGVQGRSTNLVNGQPSARFAVVRTGSYAGYGFGGFIYERSGRFTLPPTGQAGYTGRYAGLRDFNGVSGLQYVEGAMTAAIDFEDFNDSNGLIGDGVIGSVTNRIYRDLNGNDISVNVLAALNQDIQADSPGAPLLPDIPVLTFKVGPGLISQNGEIAGELESTYFDGQGVATYEEGNYYIIVSDTPTIPAGELVGVIVVEGELPLVDGATFRETGGFILYR